MIPFNKPALIGTEEHYVTHAIKSQKLCGDGDFTKKCQGWFEETLPTRKGLLVPSCTAALELAALLIGIEPGDEVIMPSYTFVSTANAFVLRGAKVVFVDVRPDTMNIDEKLVEEAITSRTRAIVPVHYAGVACEMDVIMDIASRHQLFVVEDAAQGVRAYYKGRALGSIGHLAAFSFHETKNYTSGGEGGLLIINDERFLDRAEILREKGTNRSQFLRGAVDKYSWVDVGGSYLPSELQAAYLWAQLQGVDEINTQRLAIWQRYQDAFSSLAERGALELPSPPSNCRHNAHMFQVKTSHLQERTDLIDYLGKAGVQAAFHYVPLHSARAGRKFGTFSGVDRYTTLESERLLRLPLWFGMERIVQETIISAVCGFYR